MRRMLSLLAASVVLLLTSVPGRTQELDPTVDYRYAGQVLRDKSGATLRSSKITRAFRLLYACPVTGSRYGACPGWSVDHVIPLDCGGMDAVFNMQWLPNQIKSQRGEFSKDRFERRIYGGKSMSVGCP